MQTYLDIAKQALKQHTSSDQREESKSKGYVFNEVNEFNDNDSDEVRNLIARLQAGHRWLLEQHQLWQSGDEAAASDLEFSNALNGWWQLDQGLRIDHRLQGCIYGSAEVCPSGFPCAGCSDLVAPAVVARLVMG